MPDNTNTNEDLNLEDVVEVGVDDLSDDQKVFLEENKGDLSDDQLQKFGFEKDPEPDPEPEPKTRREVKVEPSGEPDPAEEIEPEDQKTIGRIVEQKLEEAGLANTKNQIEVDSYIRENPDYGKYRKSILTFMSDPSYNNIPASYIASIVASKDQQKIGAERERAAAKKASETKDSGGGSRKPSGGETNWGGMPKPEFEAIKNEVIRGNR